MHTARLLNRILRYAKIAISTLLAQQQCNETGGGKGCRSRDCVYIPKETSDDVEEFDSDDCLMHGDNELCDKALVIQYFGHSKKQSVSRNRR